MGMVGFQHTWVLRLTAAALPLVFILLAAPAGTASVSIISRVSTTSAGGEVTAASTSPAVSADGRYVAFQSDSDDLAGIDSNGSTDVFVKDTQSGQVRLVSETAAHAAGNGASSDPAISADGRYIAFTSRSTNFDAQDTDSTESIYRKDMVTGEIVLVSVDSGGASMPSLANNPDISADGRYVVFQTSYFASGPGEIDNSDDFDIYRRDIQAGQTLLISVTTDGSQSANNDCVSPGISADGSKVVFQTGSTNLSPSDADGLVDIYMRSLPRPPDTPGTTILSTSRLLTKGNGHSFGPVLSDDGRYLIFSSLATNLLPGAPATDTDYDVFLKDLGDGSVELVSSDSDGIKGNADSIGSSISADGRYVAFFSDATNLVGADTNGKNDVFVKDAGTGAVSRESVDTGGRQGNGDARYPSISADGRYVAFHALADNLVPGDGNGQYDSFVVPAGRHFMFTWYDNFHGENWVLMTNPQDASATAWFNLSIGGIRRDPGTLEGLEEGEVPPGKSLTPKYEGEGSMSGPVDIGLMPDMGVVTSLRTLWPAGGSSIEEVVGLDTRRLSDHYYWPWYDMLSPGFSDWVLVANPGGDRVYVEISIAGSPVYSGYVEPGSNINRQFPGMMAGPVEVQAWVDASRSAPAYVMASQRVLTGGGAAFNETVGVPADELAEYYIWPWYDNVGGRNWILVANPRETAITYTITIGGAPMEGYTNRVLAGKAMETPDFPEVPITDGPVEVIASQPVIASQRVIFGPSFGETMGATPSTLGNVYCWSWYDQLSPGMRDWVLIQNPNSWPVDYSIRIGGETMPCDGGPPCTIPGSGIVTRVFDMRMGGPVTVAASGTIVASQRLLYNGYFNEVMGTPLKDLPS